MKRAPIIAILVLAVAAGCGGSSDLTCSHDERAALCESDDGRYYFWDEATGTYREGNVKDLE